MDPVRRLTLALLLASVAALGALSRDEPVDDERVVAAPPPAPSDVRRRLVTAAVYEERRCTEQVFAATPVSLAGLARRP